ncbi:hypothetical protein, partial [Escherichia coli]|uniref:hypothetical protein n=1 Tax=Escherichia coli TaxID=562 RepID=UPI00117BDCEC
EKRVFLVILFTSFSGSLVSRIPGAVHDGEIKVSFVNSPPGMRVMETRSSGFDVSHDVGYTRFGR